MWPEQAETNDSRTVKGSDVAAKGLASAIARIEGRFGVHALARGGTSERHRSELVIATKSSLDRVIGGGLVARGALAVICSPGGGKLQLALPAAPPPPGVGGMGALVGPSGALGT